MASDHLRLLVALDLADEILDRRAGDLGLSARTENTAGHAIALLKKEVRKALEQDGNVISHLG